MTDNQVDRKREIMKTDVLATNIKSEKQTDRETSQHIRRLWALCLNVTKHNGSLQGKQIMGGMHV